MCKGSGMIESNWKTDPNVCLIVDSWKIWKLELLYLAGCPDDIKWYICWNYRPLLKW